MTQTTKYFTWPTRRDMVTGYYHDPAADKELERQFYVPNITLSRSLTGGKKGGMS